MSQSDSPFDYPLMEVTEGATTLQVPRSAHVRGPKAKEGVPFYNPVMRASRDVSVLLLADQMAQSGRPWKMCDAMAALGSRGLRMAREVPNVSVQLNDANPASIQLAQLNAKRLGLRNVDFRVGRLESHLTAESYDWVDIDPFGTPAGFLEVGVIGTEDGGVLAVTATDTASLSGVYPEACKRRYDAAPRRGDCMPELALRILIGAIARAAGHRDRAITPLVCYATQHYVRAHVRVHGGAKEAGATQRQLGFAVFRADGTRELVPSAAPGDDAAGPLWTGPLWDAAVLNRLSARAAATTGLAPETRRLLSRWNEEADAPPLYVTIDDLTRGSVAEAPRLDRWIDALRADGVAVTRTHFDPRGLKTSATPAALRARLARLALAPG